MEARRQTDEPSHARHDIIGLINTDREALVASLGHCLRRVLEPYAVILAYLYGSAATGRMTPLSDVDIALALNEDALSGFPRLRFELTAADDFEQECEVSQVDVRIINDAPLMLRGRVVTDGILLFVRDQSKRIAFETRTRSEYFDFLPTALELRRAFFADVFTRVIDGRRTENRVDAKVANFWKVGNFGPSATE